MRRHTHMLVCCLLVGLALLAWGESFAQGGGPALPEISGERSDREWLAATVDLSAGEQAPLAPVIGLGDGGLALLVLDAPRAAVRWELGYDDVSIAQGSVRCDADGIGLIKIILPEARVRLACRLLLTGSCDVQRDVIVYPAAPLAIAAARLGRLRLGIVDGRGLVQRSLREESVGFDNLATSPLRRAFDGEAMIVAGVAKAEELGGVCKGLDSRVQGGMTLIIVNPPAQWSGWGVTAAGRGESAYGRVAMSKGVRQNVHLADLGVGPWPITINGPSDAEMLAWVEGSGQGEDGTSGQADALIVAMPVGKGAVVVASMPQLASPARSATGRAVLDDMILWTLRRHMAGETNEELDK